MSSWSRGLYLAVLISAIVLDGVVLYYPVDAAPRLIVGLLLLPIILWAGTRLELQEALAAQGSPVSRGRVFRELRSQVVLLPPWKTQCSERA